VLKQVKLLSSLAAGICALGSQAAHATLITVEPDDFAAGQYISYATPGVTLSTMTLTPAGVNSEGRPFYMPVYGPVYAQSVTPGCTFVGFSCAGTGSNLFGYTPTSTPSTQPVMWGEAQHASYYLNGNTGEHLTNFQQAFRADFATPTSYVDILGQFWAGDGTWLEAFNSAGESIALCFGYPPGRDATFANSGCATAWSVNESNEGWARYSITSLASDISFIITGGAANYRALDQLRFASVPEPGALGLLGAAAAAAFWLTRRRRLSRDS
jgi:hypothetical protein